MVRRGEPAVRFDYGRTPALAGITGGAAVVDRVDDLTGIDSLQVDRCDPEVGMPELPLDDRQRDPLVGHLDGVRMPQLVLVPTSAQTSLSRPGGYAEACEKVAAHEGLGVELVGIFIGPRCDARSHVYERIRGLEVRLMS